jgi:hypothetical protein
MLETVRNLPFASGSDHYQIALRSIYVVSNSYRCSPYNYSIYILSAVKVWEGFNRKEMGKNEEFSQL